MKFSGIEAPVSGRPALLAFPTQFPAWLGTRLTDRTPRLTLDHPSRRETQEAVAARGREVRRRSPFHPSGSRFESEPSHSSKSILDVHLDGDCVDRLAVHAPNRKFEGTGTRTALYDGNVFVGRLSLRKQRDGDNDGAQNTKHSVHILIIITSDGSRPASGSRIAEMEWFVAVLVTALSSIVGGTKRVSSIQVHWLT